MEHSISFKEKRGDDRWSNILFMSMTIIGDESSLANHRRCFDIIAEGDMTEEATSRESFKDNKENTLAIHSGEYSLDLSAHPGKHVCGLPWFFYTVSEEYVKYALTSLNDERKTVVGRVVCCGPYHLYCGLRDAGIDVKVATAEELDTTNIRREYLVFHDKLSNNIALREAMYKINLRDEFLFFESKLVLRPKTLTEDEIRLEILLCLFKHIRNNHQSTKEFYGEFWNSIKVVLDDLESQYSDSYIASCIRQQMDQQMREKELH